MAESDSIASAEATTTQSAGDTAISKATHSAPDALADASAESGAKLGASAEAADDSASGAQTLGAAAAAADVIVSDAEGHGPAIDDRLESDPAIEDLTGRGDAEVEGQATTEDDGAPARAESHFQRGGQTQRIVHFDTADSRDSCRDVLESDLYDWPEGINAPTVIWDVGAYVGAASLAFARQFPNATIHAFEPVGAARALVSENLASLPKATVHEAAVWSDNGSRTLFRGKGDPLYSSLVASPTTESRGEEVSVKHANRLMDELGLVRLDGLKISTGGSEVAVLEALIRFMEATPVVFIDYRSETDRRRIDLILCATHMLLKGRILGPQRGRLCYGLRRVLGKEGTGGDQAVRLHRLPN